jgi:hypothetical protein
MTSSKFDRAAYGIVQHIKDRITKNIDHLGDSWKTIPERQRRLIATAIYGSIDEGYDVSHKHLFEVHENELIIKDGFTTIPDSLVQASTDVFLQSRSEKKKVAAFTIVKDEPFFLDRWIAYYAHAVGEENLYILDNGTTDDSIQLAKQRWPKSHFILYETPKACDWSLITNTAKCFQRVLFHAYESVLFSDVDEFLLPVTGNLRKFCNQFLISNDQCIKAEGWGVIQQLDEPAIINGSMLKQRQKAWRAPQYDKTLLSKVPLDWSRGNHKVNGTIKSSSGLILLHARDIDAQVFFEHCKHRATLKNVHSPSFQGATEFNQVLTYLQTRVAPWDPTSIQYTSESRNISDEWRKQFDEAGI